MKSEFFTEPDGQLSHRRLITVLAFLTMLFCIVYSMVTGKVVSQFMYDGLQYLVMFGMGAVTAEKTAAAFAKPQGK